MRLSIPLCLLRIWCNKTDSWLSFETKNSDRYFIGPSGYFIELPDRSLAQIRPRVAFPTINRFPSLMFADLGYHRYAGGEVLFLSVPVSNESGAKPEPLTLEKLADDLEHILPIQEDLEPIERYIVLRLYESGLVKERDLQRAVAARTQGQSVGEALIQNGVCSWEFMLALCLDTPAPNKLDPPSMRTMAQRREWELTGEILLALGKIRRRDLEQALQVKRDGSQVLGQVLRLMGACSTEDIEEGLKQQKNLREKRSAEIALVGQLLVSQGIITAEALEQAIHDQHIGRQSLERILISMGICTEEDIKRFVKENDWHAFQAEIDDMRLGEWLVTTGKLTRQQLDEALRIQMRGRQVLGEMLVSMQLCNAKEMEGVLSLQKQMRTDFEVGIERLGSLLINNGKISQEALDEALHLQSIGRQPLGCILVAIGACRSDQVTHALNIQRKWREMRKEKDRLGEVLLEKGTISSDKLDAALTDHLSDGKPLGRVLIEKSLCTPEQIIDVLIERDRTRQVDFLQYLRQHIPWQNLSHSANSIIDEHNGHADVDEAEESEPAEAHVRAGAVGTKPRLRPTPKRLSAQERSIIRRILSWLYKRMH